MAKPDIDSPYPLTAEQIAQFRRDGFIKLKHVLSAEALTHYGAVITAETFRLNTMHLPIEQRDTYNKAFLQVGNIWTKNETVKEFCWGQRLARMAAELLGVRGVRMYHDQALYKEAGGGITPWHADQYYWPMSNANSVTAWIPLQAVPQEKLLATMSELHFQSSSVLDGRSLPTHPFDPAAPCAIHQTAYTAPAGSVTVAVTLSGTVTFRVSSPAA